MGLSAIGAKLATLLGTSCVFIPIMMSLVPGKGVEALPALFGSVLTGCLFHAFLRSFIERIRFALPPLVTGLMV